jgi:hypothetical protein
MLHVRIDSPPWGPDVTLNLYDRVLEGVGSIPIVMPFETMALEADGDHFTRNGQAVFNKEFAASIRNQTSSSEILVLADSTIDFHNWSDEDVWTGWASNALHHALQQNDFRNIIVDAICGSGFIARAYKGEHFYARLSHHLRVGYKGPVVFIGGWNDKNLSRDKDVKMAIERCASVIERYMF